MKTIETHIPGPLIIEPRFFRDERGFFVETFNARAFEACGLPREFLQDNHSMSSQGVVRGLHYQVREPQGKLVRCTRGVVFDVAVDLRRSSPMFGRWAGVTLSEENGRMFWIPPGFAHGFAAVQDAELMYKCTTIWDPDADRSLLWCDATLAIDWPVSHALVSPKDAEAPGLSDAELFP